MISSGALCTISVFVSNLCCLALFSFFSSILPSKRNLLTQLNTVLVFVLTAMVNVMVRWNKTYADSKSSFEKSQNPLLDVIFSSVAPAWSRPHVNSQPLWQWFFSWFCFGFRRFCKEFLSHSAWQGCSWSSRWKKSIRKRIHLIGHTQPTEFNQLDHERRFKLVFFCLLTGNTIFSLAALTLNNLLAEGQG